MSLSPLDNVFDDIEAVHEQVIALTRQYFEQLQTSNKSLEEHAQVLSSILESLPVGIIVTDRDDRLLLTNSAVVKLTGVELTQDSWPRRLDLGTFVRDGQLVDPESNEQFIQELLSSRQAVDYELLCIGKKHAVQKWFRVYISPIVTKDDEVLGLVRVYSDITNRKESQQRIDDLYNNAPCGYQSLDPDGRFIEVNETEAKLFGVSRRELLEERRFQDFIVHEDRERFDKAFAHLRQTGSLAELQLRVNAADGVRTIAWTSSAVNDGDGHFKHTSGTLFDITDRAELKAKCDYLAAIIAHDIKNHLSAVEAFFSFIRNTGVTVDAEMLETMQLLTLSTQDCLQMVSNLMQVYQLETRDLSLAMKNVDLRNIVAESMRVVRPYSKMLGVPVDINIPEESIAVAGDISLRHVFINLLHNAIKHSERGQPVTVSSYLDDSYATIQVADHGPGVPEEVRKAIFSPIEFSQDVISKDQQSYGLALYLSQELVKGHGGTISYADRPGGGAVFSVALPLVNR